MLRLHRERTLLTRGRRAGRCLLALLLIVAWAPALTAQVVRQTARETSVKAAFLYRFTHFAEWPPEAMGGKGDPITMCVTGRDELAEGLEHAVEGRKSRNRPLVVRRVDGTEGAAGCHVLFIGWSDLEAIDRILGELASQPTLTVGDVQGFARRGGMINLMRDGKRMRFEINRGAAERARIQLSSQLLKLAQIVDDEGGGGQ